MTSIETSNEELRTVREAMRGLNQMLDQLDRGDVEKIVLWQGATRMRAVILTVENYAALVKAARP